MDFKLPDDLRARLAARRVEARDRRDERRVRKQSKARQRRDERRVRKQSKARQRRDERRVRKIARRRRRQVESLRSGASCVLWTIGVIVAIAIVVGATILIFRGLFSLL